MSSAKASEIPRERRAAIYARYSTDMQSDKSCQDQIREATQTCQKHDLAVVVTDGDEKTRARAWKSRLGFQRLLDAAKRGEYGVLAVENLSRFARQGLGSADKVMLLAGYKVRILDCLTGKVYDPNDTQDYVFLTFLLTQAEMDTKARSQMSRRGHLGVATSGHSTGGGPPFGYKGVRDTSGVKWVPDPTIVEVVRRMFELYDGGVSAAQIGKMPEIAEPYLRWRKPTSKRVRGYLQQSTVHVILRNEIYAGQRVWGKNGRTGALDENTGRNRNVPQPDERQHDIENFCEPIVDVDLWERVQARLEANAAEHARTGTANRVPHLLSGLIRCASCSFAFSVSSSKKNRSAYRCQTKGCANRCSVFREPLEAKMRNTIEIIGKNPAALSALVSKHNENIEALNSGQLVTVRRLEDTLRTMRIARDNLVAGIALGGDIPSLHAALKAKEEEIATVERALGDAKDKVQPLLQLRTLREVHEGDAPFFSGDLDEDRAVIRDLVHRLVVYPDGYIVVEFKTSALVAQPYDRRIFLEDLHEVHSPVSEARRWQLRSDAFIEDLLSAEGEQVEDEDSKLDDTTTPEDRKKESAPAAYATGALPNVTPPGIEPGIET